MRDYRDSKVMAQALREALAIQTIVISHSEGLELVSKMLGFSDWNTLSAKIQNEPDSGALSPAVATGLISPADERPQRLADQAAPRKAISFDVAVFDRFCGMYESTSHDGIYCRLFRENGKLFAQISGGGPIDIYPESETKFFATSTPWQFSFLLNRKGQVTDLILHQFGFERRWKRDDQLTLDSIKSALEERIRKNKPQRGSEAALRRFIAGLMSGTPNYDDMGEDQAWTIRQQLDYIGPLIAAAGAIKSLKFIGIDDTGDNIYHVEHEHRLFRWSLFLNAEGKVDRSWVLPGG